MLFMEKHILGDTNQPSTSTETESTSNTTAGTVCAEDEIIGVSHCIAF